jgi:nucleotide-binding universal stress UspA family protein
LYKKMLVPLDGSELAETVLPYATELAGRMDLEMVLLHVCSTNWAETQHLCQSYIDHVAETASVQSQELQSKIGLPSNKTIKARTELLVGHPAEEIIHFADENNVDFILIGSHGHSGVSRWVLGSVADKVLRASRVPVWLVRAGIMEEIARDEWSRSTILVPLDGSKFAESVLPHVETLARQKNAKPFNVVLLRVYEKPPVTADYPEPDWNEHVKLMIDHFKGEAVQYLSGVEKRLADAGLRVRSEVLAGKPAGEIIEYTNKNHPILIVMASHGSSGLSRWEYGDIANKVLYGSSSPVFLVRPE